MSSKNPIEWEFVLTKIDKTQQYQYKAFGFFDLNNQTFLSFVAAFISMSVLFVQLINQTQSLSNNNVR